MPSIHALARLPHSYLPTDAVPRIAGHTVELMKSAASRASASFGVSSATDAGQRRDFSAARSADILGRLQNTFNCEVVDEAQIQRLYKELLQAQAGQNEQKTSLIPQVELTNGQKAYLGSRPDNSDWRLYGGNAGKYTLEISTTTKLSSLTTHDRPSAPGVVYLGPHSLHAQTFQIELKKDEKDIFRVTKFTGFESCKLFDRDGGDLLPAPAKPSPALRDRLVQWIRQDGRG